MDSKQKLVLERIEQQIEKAGFTPAMSKDWANTGRIEVLDPKTLDTVATIAFDFQTSYFSLTTWTGGGPRPASAEKLSTIGDQSTSDMLAKLDDFLTRRAFLRMVSQ